MDKESFVKKKNEKASPRAMKIVYSFYTSIPILENK